MRKDIIIVGGGFFGMYLAEQFSLLGHGVKLFEKESNYMSRASYNNQARVHNGYHYPRSILTALRSRISFPRFVEEFRDCVDSDFDKYYLISELLGKVSAGQFRMFCKRIGADCDVAPAKIQNMVNPQLIDACFTVKEFAFDAFKLRDMMLQRLESSTAEYRCGYSVDKVESSNDRITAYVRNINSGEVETHHADHVFNCTYSHLNYLLDNSGIELIPLKHEMTEMCLVDVPDELKKTGFTIMCGPFFSVMPFPSVGLHSFSHVRYTPHYEWHDTPGEKYRDSHVKFDEDQRNSAWQYMVKDASRYMPILNDCRYERSLWEVKTLLPRSETDDSRPILFRPNHGMNGFHCIMGGKIDNVYDAVEAIKKMNVI
ncbi:FAD-dependent oxidoreductase [Citrobacter sp. MNAZ 1397]|uniref:FAD-dependent oxidoreductase n=1 Tax=Citrobacter sp. MNAZ 1397 TaxID=2911205 RepID=UPI002025DBD9|nr:FAD-dependent oxidoreductase [Citrobacter sp. MNAZ 1397]MCL9670155.1 FAD-binding oxidoreductase [Citrobacter sp. MNAZ 1397]